MDGTTFGFTFINNNGSSKQQQQQKTFLNYKPLYLRNKCFSPLSSERLQWSATTLQPAACLQGFTELQPHLIVSLFSLTHLCTRAELNSVTEAL